VPQLPSHGTLGRTVPQRKRLILALDFEVEVDPYDKDETSDELVSIQVLDDGNVETDAISEYWGQSDFGQVTVTNGFLTAIYSGYWEVEK
jgi:hypothetical protein